jgi:hypothetical protein
MRAWRSGWFGWLHFRWLIFLFAGGVALAQTPLLPLSPLSVEAAQSLGAEWELLLRKGEVTAVTSRLDLRALSEKALATLPGDDDARREFVSQYAAGAGTAFQHALRGFVHLRFLGVVRTNDAGGLVFRALLPDGSATYFRFLVQPQATGGVAITDVFVLPTGEWMSATIRWLYLLSEGKRGPGLAAKLTGAQAELVRSAAAVERLLLHHSKKNFMEFSEAYRALPTVLQEDRTLLQLQLSATLAAAPSEFGVASQTWKRRYPSDPGLDLVAFPTLAGRGEHTQAALALGRLEDFIGGDHCLRALRGVQLARGGQVDAGKRLAEEAVLAEPDLATGYDALLGIAIHARNFTEIARVLNDAADHLPINPRELVQSQPQYAEFLASAIGRQWLSRKPVVNNPRPKPMTNSPAAIAP